MRIGPDAQIEEEANRILSCTYSNLTAPLASQGAIERIEHGIPGAETQKAAD